MAWVTPIYDRMMLDVKFALQKIEEWRKSGATDTTDLKGCFNASDMNRIEQNIKYLSDELAKLYYFASVSIKTWDRSSMPTKADVDRIISNVNKIITSYYQTSDAPALPSTLLTITDVNSLEKNLYKIKMILDGMIFSFRECDTFYCGED